MKTFQLTVLLGFLFMISVSAQEFTRIEYLCADWGPAMTCGKTNELPQFSDTEEEIYFLKQMGGHSGNAVYLCKMRPDGSGKMEIKELWHNTAYPIITQSQSTWMDVNGKSRRIVFSVTYAGSDLTGLWVLSLDGTSLKRIYSPNEVHSDVFRVNHPSWASDGGWIIFDQRLKGEDLNQYRIARCDSNGNNMTRLIEDSSDQQPSVSPDGKRIAYIHHIGWSSRLYLMNVDGSNPHPLPNPDNKQGGIHGGTWPTWSQDGTKILLSARIIDVESGKVSLERRPMLQGKQGTYGWPHWGRSSIVGFCVGGILLTDPELREGKWIGSSKVVECSGQKDACRW